MYKVLITTSGFGERLKPYTEFWNKSLILIGKKPVISYIIDRYPKDIEIVVTTRYLGWQVKDFLLQAYPDRKFTFSEEPQEPPADTKFSLGSSMLFAKEYLQCPFIFHAGDTIINEPIPAPDKNWSFGFPATDSTHYTTFDIVDGKIPKINEKGAAKFQLAHIGLIGIKDYQLFWQCLEELYKKDPTDTVLNDTRATPEVILLPMA
jgi:dTDP-glucose pyrophosphorylase